MVGKGCFLLCCSGPDFFGPRMVWSDAGSLGGALGRYAFCSGLVLVIGGRVVLHWIYSSIMCVGLVGLCSGFLIMAYSSLIAFLVLIRRLYVVRSLLESRVLWVLRVCFVLQTWRASSCVCVAMRVISSASCCTIFLGSFPWMVFRVVG